MEETMFAVYAAEQQYRHDTWARQRDHAVSTAIRERRLAAASAASETALATVRPERAPWARPIGLRSQAECTTACAVA
jgi:hypothetical protein